MRVHTVKSGDTLGEIASRNHVSLRELIRANPQIKNPDLIRVGQRIKIPDHRDDSRTPRAPAASAPAASGVGHDAPKVYRVKRGDTLGEIASRHNVSLTKLLRANPKIKNPNLIHVGQTISIPQQGGSAGGRRTGGGGGGSYKVRSGDTMGRIAQRHGVSLQKLIAANPQVKNPNLIHPGQVLKIPGGGGTGGATPPRNRNNSSGPHLEVFPVGGGRYNIGYDGNWNNFNKNTALHNSDFYHGDGTNHPNGHLGIDIFGPRGAPIRAPVSGQVVSVSRHDSGAGGLSVTIKRGNHYFYMCHLTSVANLRVGQHVEAGTAVGTLGNTGNARGTAPHLHFSIYKNGSYTNSVNPFQYLKAAM